MVHFLVLLITLLVSVQGFPNKRNSQTQNVCFPFVDREAWGAREPLSRSNLTITPAPYVVIHHTYIPKVCITREECDVEMREIQDAHMDENGWSDFGYSFAIGGEGSVFEGRGWKTVGAHTVSYNTQSIGIVLIGDFVSKLPEEKQLKSTKALIAAGVTLGYIRPDYQLFGHRQASATECPGQALYMEIKTWEHFTEI